MKVVTFKSPELQEWLRAAGMEGFIYRPFDVDRTEVARLTEEARAQHPTESPAFIEARGIGRALALKLSREKRSKVSAEQAVVFKPTPWNWGRILDWGFRAIVVGILLLIFLLGIPLRGHAQQRSLRVQWKDEGVILGTRGGGNLWIIDCTGAGLTCTISGATITIDGSAGSGSQHQVDGVNVLNNATINFRDTTRILVANPTLGNIDFDIATGGIDVLGLFAASLCGTNQILEDQGASWACIATPGAGGGSQHQIDGVNLTSNDPINFLDTSEFNWTNPAAGNLSLAIIAASIADSKLTSNYSGIGTCTNQFARVLNDNAAPTCATVTATDTSGTFPADSHDLLSVTHGDTTAAVVARGDLVTGQLLTPKWQRLALGAVNLYPKSDGTDLVYSTLAASGVGACGANQFETGDNADAAPTCVQPNFTNLTGTASDAQVDGSLEADELVLAGDVDGTANANDLDELAVEVELEAVLDLPDLQGLLVAGQYGAASIDGDDLNTNLAGSGLVLTAAAPDILDIDLLTADDQVGSSSNQSGMEFGGAGSDKLGLLRGCLLNQLLKFNTTGGLWECAADNDSGGSPTLDSIIAAAGAATINSGDNAIIWNWQLTTSDKVAFKFGENVAGTATGNPILLNAVTLAASTVHPFQATARGTVNGIRVGAANGVLIALGTGGLNWPALLGYPTGCTNQFVRTIADTLTCNTVATADIALGAADNTIIRDSAGFSVIGKSTTGTGDPADIVAGDETVFGRTGAGNLVFAQVATGQIANSAINSAKLATANKTFDKSIDLIDPSTADDDLIQWMHGKAVTYTDIDCSTDAGTTVTIDMDHRVITTPNTVGTDIITGTIVCDDNNQSESGFADATIPANVPVNLSITATSGTPGVVRIHIRGTVD